MKRSLQLARAAAIVVATFCFAACSGSSTTSPTPTPTPVPDPPKITCPKIDAQVSEFASPITVVFGDATVAGGKDPITKSCTPASGSTFRLGDTTVTCTATDALQRSDSCSLTVTVTPPPRVALTRFVAFGDSITRGENGESLVTTIVDGRMIFFNPIVQPAVAYPTVLQQALKARYTLQSDSIVVSNQGVSGQAAADLSTPGLLSAALPGNQVLLLMMGTNDLYAAHQATDGSGRVTLGVNAIQSMVRTARGANLRVYLATIPPMNPTGSRGSIFGWELVAGFNDRLRSVASSEGATLVDVNKAFNGDFSLLSSDGLHPNASGYALIADTFFQSIKATLEQSTTTGLRPTVTQGALPHSQSTIRK